MGRIKIGGVGKRIFRFTGECAMIAHQGRERPEKILVAMHRLSNGGTRLLDYDDIVVEAYRMFPGEFSLRKYPQYPDSSDVHKPLYGVLKKHGLIRASNKQFGLTLRGVEVASGLVAHAGTSLDEARSAERLTRAIEAELDRMLKSAALDLFAKGRGDRILDTDFYTFIGCTVRTKDTDFQARLNASREAIEVAARLNKPDSGTARLLRDLMKRLEQQFKDEIQWKVGKNGRRTNKNGH